MKIDEPPAHLEGADRGVVLMLDHDIHARACPQQRPGILRRRRHGGAHDRQDGVKLGEAEHGSGIRSQKSEKQRQRKTNSACLLISCF